MAECFHPLHGFRRPDGGFTMSRLHSASGEPLVIGCGRCLGCRLRNREGWKVRLMDEASLHECNSFVTLTYAPQNLPPHGSLRYADVQGFLKRLRRRIEPLQVRFYCRPEYGPTTFLPHYHLSLHGFDFPDRRLWRTTDADCPSYVSDLLTETWGLGHCECSDLTPQSCGYVANHNVDKLDFVGLPDDFYEWIDPETGEVFTRERDLPRMSNRPGIGAGWIERFESDVFPHGYVVRQGRKMAVPRYYKNRLKGRFKFKGSVNDPDRLIVVDDALLMARKAKARASDPARVADRTPERLAVREEFAHLRLKRLKRGAI